MTFMFEHLEVYQKSVNFADRLLELTETLPKGYRFLVGQLNRATLSIAANIFKKPSHAHDSELTADDMIIRYGKGQMAGIAVPHTSNN